MPLTDFDDLDVQDDPESEEYVRIRKSHLTDVRAAAKSSAKNAKELEGIRRQSAITDAGLKDLNGEQREALAALVSDPTADNLRAKAEALGWVQKAPEPEAASDAEIAAHAEIANAGQGAGAPQPTVATPEQVAAWPVDKRMRFQAAHSDLHEALLRGDTINIPTAFI